MIFISSYANYDGAVQDGPASILPDGDIQGAVNLTGMGFAVQVLHTDDGYMILSSEVGVLDIDPTNCFKERLHPGKMLLVDTVEGRVIDDEELKNRYASRQPYGEWLDQYLVSLKDLKIPNKRVESYGDEMRMRLMKAFGYITRITGLLF